MPTYRLPMLTDAEWRRIAVCIPRPRAGPAPRQDREIVSAICYATASNSSIESLSYPRPMNVRTRLRRWEKSGVLGQIFEAAAPAIARMRAGYWDYLRYLSFGRGWKARREADDPELANLPKLTHRIR